MQMETWRGSDVTVTFAKNSFNEFRIQMIKVMVTPISC